MARRNNGKKQDKATAEVVHQILPADDFYWNSVENEYTPLSEKEIAAVIDAGISSNVAPQGLVTLLNWATEARIHTLMLAHLMNGRLAVCIGKDNEVRFIPRQGDA